LETDRCIQFIARSLPLRAAQPAPAGYSGSVQTALQYFSAISKGCNCKPSVRLPNKVIDRECRPFCT